MAMAGQPVSRLPGEYQFVLDCLLTGITAPSATRIRWSSAAHESRNR